MSDVKNWNVWDLIKHISESDEVLNWEDIRKIYEPWIINRAFQSDLEVLDKWVLNLNRYANMPKEIQYKLLQKHIPKKKRYLKYLKDTKYDKNVKIFAEWFGLSDETMNNYLRFLSDDKKKKIVNKIDSMEKMKSGKDQNTEKRRKSK